MRQKITKKAQAGAPRRLYYRAREVAQLTGLGLRTIYEGIYTGRIPSRKIGDARLIPAEWLTARTDVEAEEVRRAFAPSPVQNSPKNRYSLANARAIREGVRVCCGSRFRSSCERRIA